VRLVKQPHFLEIGHNVADSGRADIHGASFGNGPGPDRLAGFDIVGDNGFQDRLITLRKLDQT
jgi:hypothetical protein